MRIGMVGLAGSGKTTLFNALTHAHAHVGGYAASDQPNVAVVKVPDARLETLAAIYRPKKVTPATIEFIDPPAPHEDRTRSKYPFEHVADADALLVVIRQFDDPNVAVGAGTINPRRDLESFLADLYLADLEKIDTRIVRLEKTSHKKKDPVELKELALLQTCRQWVEQERPLRSLDLSAEDEKKVRGFRFYTLKPLLIVVNIDEASLPQAETVFKEVTAGVLGPGTGGLALCAKLEAELADLKADDAAAFLQDLRITELATGRLIRLSYDVVGLVSFLTAGDPEVRAWPIPIHTTAMDAAGTIHTDMARGFIRAETVPYQDLAREGSYAKCRDKGLVRLEGKHYVVQDGDVILFRFNV